MHFDVKYMKRALELAEKGEGYTSPNPLVGAVIVHDDCIIGEGYHRQYGKAHAEVNAVNSVADKSLLRDSTIYVTLEPCAHYGKTPPCAQLIIDCGIPRVVVGAIDPFAKVAGRGINMLREAGVEVVTGVMAAECQQLNVKFFTAHTLRSPYVTLKWAQSVDGYMDHRRTPGNPLPARFSTPVTTMLVHRQRALHDAVLTTANTVNADDCRLTVRSWTGRSPRPVILDRHNILNPDAAILALNPIVYNCDMSLKEIMSDLYEHHGITSVLVEAGPTMLQRFIDLDMWDAVRVEVAPIVLGEQGTCKAPQFPAAPSRTYTVGANTLYII